MLDRLDAALSATAGTTTVLLAGWLLLSLLTALALRVADGRTGGRTRGCLDRTLRLLAPGLAGRALRAAVGIGAAGTAVFAGVAFPQSSAVAQAAGVPTPAPARFGTAPVSAPVLPAAAVPARHAPAPLVVAEPRQPAPDLWPLSPGARAHGRPAHGRPAHSRPPADHRRGENPAQAPVVVLRGDTLWVIAARHLPAGASNVSIDAAWHRWFEVNRAVIGPDPDLLLPGQVLRAPG